MTAFEIVALLITLTALFAFANHRLLKLPTAIGVMVLALASSVVLIIIEELGLPIAEPARAVVDAVEFDDAVLHAMLGPLLFAGALFVNLDDLLAQKGTISLFATLGVLFSILMVGAMLFVVSPWLGTPIPWIYCLLFGALVSPTDPIAVLGILRKLGVSKRLETKFTGESLFNDGVGVVAFITLFEIASGSEPTLGHTGSLFLAEIGGGAALGVILGSGAYALLKRVDNYQVEILVSLALVTGGYALSESLHLSAPIFAVVGGLLIGNAGRRYAMSENTREHLDAFWELIDEMLNALLFVLIGLEILVLRFSLSAVALGACAVPVVMLSRFVSIGALVRMLRLRREFSPHVVKILTWGGLRGGISVALALSLPPGPYRDQLVTATYFVVAFSIIVQGLTIGPLIRRMTAGESLR